MTLVFEVFIVVATIVALWLGFLILRALLDLSTQVQLLLAAAQRERSRRGGW